MPRAGLNRREINDTGLMAQFFNAIRARSSRRIDWLHLPVPRHHGEVEYFAPLHGLERDAGTELYLGLLYPDDGIERTRQKLEVACGCVGEFGVAAACGLNPFVSGMPVERLPETLDYHRKIGELT
jgi:hypothetical protein